MSRDAMREGSGDMMRLDLPLVLPEVEDEQDRCRTRLQELLEGREGIREAHFVAQSGSTVLCVHYDRVRLSLRQVEELVRLAGAQVTERYGHGVFALRAVDGEDAGRRVEALLTAQPGVLEASVNVAAHRIRVEWERARIDADRIQAVIRDLGYEVDRPVRPSVPATPDGCCAPREAVSPQASWAARNGELLWSLAAGALLAIAWGGARWLELPRQGAIALFLLSYGCGARDLVRHSVASWRRGRFSLDIDLLMLLAAAGAAVLGNWAEGAFLLFLFSLAHALQHLALGKARGAISALAELGPPTAQVRRGSEMVEVRIEQVAPGEIVVVRPAERVPVDGDVVRGRSSVNQAPITGESVPVEKGEGDAVYAGTVNGDGALEIRTTRAIGDRTLDRVIRLVEEAQTQKAPTQQFTDRFERVFVPLVLVADLLLIVLPPLMGFWDWQTGFYRGMTLLVAASPCALALGTPAAVLAGIAQAARHGVLIKGGAHLESLGAVRAVAFDKTGTLTRGEPEVTDVVPFDGASADELLALAAAVERLSQHPLAAAVVRRAMDAGLALPEAEALQSVTARGVRAEVAGVAVEIGSPRMWESDGGIPEPLQAAVEALQERGRSTMLVRHGRRWLGTIGVADRPREGMRALRERLRTLGIDAVIMLTGDNRRVGESVAHELGIEEVFAELLPEQKAGIMRELLARHGGVAMVGDGVNDAPALANATVGIAMGGAGTAVALETADVALMGDDPRRLPFAIGLSRQARRVIRQNLGVSLVVIAVLVLSATMGLAGIGVTVIVHEGSTLVVIANALRLLAYGDVSAEPEPGDQGA